MVFGHLAAGSLGQQCLFRRAGLPFCLVAAFGPDWIDKPLKLFLGLPGHGIAHSLCGTALFLGAFAWACRRFSLPACWPVAAAFFWALHLLCDMVKPAALLWPVLGPFPVFTKSTSALAWSFYTARPLSTMAWCDLALVALAAAARLAALQRRPAMAHGRP